MSATAIGEVDWTDMFCGAGGSSLGIQHVPGMRVTQALNHWDLAVEAHNHNFPDSDHDVHDVQDIPAQRFRRTRCLWASPECTHHAYCRGPRDDSPEANRSRSTFGDVVRFTEYHRYDVVIVENVIEARLWCDVKSHGRKCSCGYHFDRWFKAMLALGYEGRILYFNSQFALPTPQSRDRMYVVFWRKGLRAPNLDFQPYAWCPHCEKVARSVQSWKPASPGSLRTRKGLFEWGRYGSQYLYLCPSCANPAAPAVTGAKTIIDWTFPSQLIGDRDKPLAPKTRQRIKIGLERLGKLQPVQVQVGGNLYERPGYARVWSVDDPLRTVTGTPYMAVVAPVGGQEGAARTIRGIDEPLGSVTTENHRALVVRAGGQNGNGRGTDEPMQTVVGSDRQVAVVVPNRAHNVGGSVDEPVGAVTTAPAQHMLVKVAGAHRGDPRPQTLDEPTRTVAGHGELGIVSMRNHGGVTQSGEPVPALTAGGYHHGMLVYNGVPGFVRSLEDAAGTLTGRDKQSLLVPYYTTGVARPTDEPMGTVTAKDRQALVITDEDIDACQFRMLQWWELLRAQQMHQHVDGRPYELTARKRDKRGNMRELSNEQRVKMIGNAVSSPVAAMLAHAIADTLASAA